MRSIFDVDTIGCLVCNNGVMANLGKLQGVFGATVDFLNGRITVEHTEEVDRQMLLGKLNALGFREKESKTNINKKE